MTLYNIIRDWFVQYVWGGTLSSGYTRQTTLGYVVNEQGANFNALTNQFYVPISGFESRNNLPVQYINFSDWLSTTSTIITMVVILVCIAFFIRWIFKVCSNAILLR